MFGACPPRQALGTLYSYLARLRKALDGADQVAITHRSGGYVLTAGSAVVDVHQFRRLAAQARETDDDQVAASLYDQTLRLWRAEPFGDLDTPWLGQMRDALEAERRAMELAHHDVKLRLGQHADLLAHLATRTADHPLDERLAGQLMLALYRMGRQGDALAHYQRIRQRLADELGADPGAPLRELHRRILLADADLAVPTQQPAAGQISLA